MNGAESLLRTAAAAGIRVCFANPGTTELPLVAAFDSDTGIGYGYLYIFSGLNFVGFHIRMVQNDVLSFEIQVPAVRHGLGGVYIQIQ